MSIKKIIRPETETHMIEFPFHWCKDKREYNNAVADVDENDIEVIRMHVDPDTFQPSLYFAIRKKDRPFAEWLKYGVILEHTN